MKYSYSNIKKTYKKIDTIVSTPFNYISTPIVWFVSNFTHLTPNQISTISFIIGLIAAVCFYYKLFILGAILFEISFLFDCVDGKLARLKTATSKLGDMYDHVLGQFLMLILILPLMKFFFEENINTYSIYLLVTFIFLSPFNYFINYYSKYTFQEVYNKSILSSTSKSNNSLTISITKIRNFFHSIKIAPLPTDVEAIHFMFLITPILIYYGYKTLAMISIILANIVFIISILSIVYRNIKMSKIV